MTNLSFGFFPSMHPTLNLTKPQNQRSPDDNAHPVTERQGNHTEHLATKGNDENLSESYY